jgi:hypothetical protein
MTHKLCGNVECAIQWAEREREKKERKEARLEARRQLEEKRDHKDKLEKLKTRSEWIQEAEMWRRRRRRLEELAKGEGCISCKRTQEEVMGIEGWKPGGCWDAGHFLSKGARPNLRLTLNNIWLQCKSCNAGSAKYARKQGTVSAAYRINLIEKIGVEAVETLENDHEPRHWTIDDLKVMIAEDKLAVKNLKSRENL